MTSWLRRLLAYSWPVRVLLGAYFIYSAVPKLPDLARFASIVRSYEILPAPLATAFGYALPFAELAVGLPLLLGLFTRLAAAGGLALLVSFLIAIGVNIARGATDLECGCFTAEPPGAEPSALAQLCPLCASVLDWFTASATVGWSIFARDVVLLAAMALPFLDRERLVSLDRWIAGEPEPAGEEGEPAQA